MKIINFLESSPREGSTEDIFQVWSKSNDWKYGLWCTKVDIIRVENRSNPGFHKSNPKTQTMFYLKKILWKGIKKIYFSLKQIGWLEVWFWCTKVGMSSIRRRKKGDELFSSKRQFSKFFKFRTNANFDTRLMVLHSLRRGLFIYGK